MKIEMSEAAKEARRQYYREWREKNREHYNSYLNNWKKRNKDKVRAYEAKKWERRAEREGLGEQE